MPLASGANHAVLRRRFETDNAPFKGLDWEVEDLLSERLLSGFCQTKPAAVLEVHERTGRKHREFTSPGKHHLREFVKRHAVLEDVIEIVKLIRALHDYFHLQVDYIAC
jgi:antitoxin HigA-1